MFCFKIMSDFGENRKRGKLEKSGHFGFLRHSVGCLVSVRPKVQKWYPSGTPQRSKATPWLRPTP